MKLWKKLSLVCGGILVLIVTACTLIQLRQTTGTLYTLTEDRLEQKYDTLSRSFQQMLSYYQAEEDTPAVEHALYHYCFSRLAGANCVLIVDGEAVWKEMNFQPKELDLLNLPQQMGADGESAKIYRLRENYALYGGAFRLNTVGTPKCWVYVIENITPLKESIWKMVWQFIGIGFICILAGLGLIMLFVRRTMKPLKKLQGTAAEIAAGNYERRVKVQSIDEVGALAVSFNHMADCVQTHVTELTEAARRQRLFTSAVTHEFKTPLTGILLNADSLQNTCMSEEEQADALYAIQEQGRWLEKLVQKLLKLLTLRQGITRREICVPDLLESVRETTAEVLRQRGVTLDIQCGMKTLTGDEDLLRSALVNLVDNASKASKPGQTVWLTAGGRIIEVADQGTGISAEDVKHITEPFYMADRSRSKCQGGVGLGLALVQEIATAHGAALEVESTPGIGTIVRLRFPS